MSFSDCLKARPPNNLRSVSPRQTHPTGLPGKSIKTLDQGLGRVAGVEWPQSVLDAPDVIAHPPAKPSRVRCADRDDESTVTRAGARGPHGPHSGPYVLDEKEFLSPYGIRSLSKVHEKHPYILHTGDEEHRVDYTPGESISGLFGGNSNWRGPIWFPLNFLLVESLEVYHHFYGESFKVECPTGSGNFVTLLEAARQIEFRLSSLFLADDKQRRPCHGADRRYAEDPHWRDLVLFYEFFHGDTGRGMGASHQTGWTALVAPTISDISRKLSE